MYLTTQINAQKGIPINQHDKYAYRKGLGEGRWTFCGLTKLPVIQAEQTVINKY